MSTALEREQIREIDHPGFVFTEWMVELVTDAGIRYGVSIEATKEVHATGGLHEVTFTQATLGPLGTALVLREAYILRHAQRIAPIPTAQGSFPLYVGSADSFTLAGIELNMDPMSKIALGV